MEKSTIFLQILKFLIEKIAGGRYNVFVTVFLFKKYVKSNKKRFDAEASNLKLLERVTGIEPAYSAWEADVLPLNYTRKKPKQLGKTELLKWSW